MRTMALPAASALLGIAAFLPFPLAWLAALVCLVPLFVFFQNERRLGWLLLGTALFRLIFAAGTVYFAFEPLGWIASALLLLGLPLSFHLLRRYAGAGIAFAALPILWTIWDLLEARYTFLPMYIIALGNALAPSPFLGLASWGGFIGLTFFGALINTIVAAAFLMPRRNIVAGVAAVLCIFAGWAASRTLISRNAAEYAARPKEIRIAAVSTSEAFDRPVQVFEVDALVPEERVRAAGLIADAIRPVADELAAHGPFDLVILPEDMIDLESWADADPEAKEKFSIESGGVLIAAYRALARRLNADIAATFTTIQGSRRYNSTLLFGRTGELIGLSNKVRLAIGGEYWPFGNWRPFYWNLAGRIRPEITEASPLFDLRYQYSAGGASLLAADGFSFAQIVCIEAHYPDDLAAYRARGADFIVHTANNRWVAHGLDQYLRLTDNLRRIEAVWLETPIVINGRGERAGIITPDGRVDALPFGKAPEHYRIFFGTLRI